MSAYIRLQGYYTEHLRGGVRTVAPTVSISLGDGTTVEMPIPFIPIGEGLGITPAIQSDGKTSLRFDFTRWAPLRYGHDLAAGFPVAFLSQELAVRVTRAFDADPRTSWRDPGRRIESWVHTWMTADGQALR